MSIKTKTFSLSFGFIIISLIWLFFVGFPGTSYNGNIQIKEITLVTKGMAFRIQEQVEHHPPSKRTLTPEVNPSLVLGANERVQIVIRNEDPGILHSLAIQGVELGLSRPLRYGQSEVLTFTAPEEGRIEYFCTEHPEMMRGEIIVREKTYALRGRD